MTGSVQFRFRPKRDAPYDAKKPPGLLSPEYAITRPSARLNAASDWSGASLSPQLSVWLNHTLRAVVSNVNVSGGGTAVADAAAPAITRAKAADFTISKVTLNCLARPL